MVLIATLGVAGAACPPRSALAAEDRSGLDVYRTFERPDGAFRIVVLRKPMPFAMPGQAGDAPGIIRLFDRNGRLLAETDVEMVQFVNDNTVEWSSKTVSIRLVVDWTLP